MKTSLVLCSFAVLLFVVSVNLAGCAKGPEKSAWESSPPPPATASRNPSVSATGDALQEPGTRKKGVLPAFDENAPSAPLVGGCGDACGSARKGFEGFARALLLERLPADLPFVRFMDTSILVDNGQALGAEWARLDLEGRQPERQWSIDSWLEKYNSRVGWGVSAQDLEAALGSAASLQRLSSIEVRLTFTPPPRDGATTTSTWNIVMTRRGLEWLVSEIQDAP